MKMIVFWDVEPRNLVEITDISGALTASIIRREKEWGGRGESMGGNGTTP